MSLFQSPLSAHWLKQDWMHNVQDPGQNEVFKSPCLKIKNFKMATAEHQTKHCALLRAKAPCHCTVFMSMKLVLGSSQKHMIYVSFFPHPTSNLTASSNSKYIPNPTTFPLVPSRLPHSSYYESLLDCTATIS